MDALLAERVMGWTPQARSGVGFTTPEGEYRSIDIWTPSVDIAAAWQVVEKLDRDGWWWTLDKTWTADGPDQWQVSLLPSESLQTDRRGDALAPTAPHAICLAALRAVGALPDPRTRCRVCLGEMHAFGKGGSRCDTCGAEFYP